MYYDNTNALTDELIEMIAEMWGLSRDERGEILGWFLAPYPYGGEFSKLYFPETGEVIGRTEKQFNGEDIISKIYECDGYVIKYEIITEFDEELNIGHVIYQNIRVSISNTSENLICDWRLYYDINGENPINDWVMLCDIDSENSTDIYDTNSDYVNFFYATFTADENGNQCIKSAGYNSVIPPNFTLTFEYEIYTTTGELPEKIILKCEN